MQFVAKARYVSYSPYKIRPLADVIRGKNAGYALNWLMAYKTQRTEALTKLLASAIANAKHLKNIDSSKMMIKEIKVDGGPIHRYFKPGAQGRAMPQRRRLCHMSVILESLDKEA